MKRALNPFERWMVKSNLQYVPAEGVQVVTDRLRANGYPQIADAVQSAHDEERRADWEATRHAWGLVEDD